MQLHHIRQFLAICETGSITQAATYCNVSQPAITRSIRALELEFGGPLFDRSAAGSRLTSLGQQLKPFFDEINLSLQAASELAQRNREEKNAVFRLGITCTLGTAPVQSFLKRLQRVSPKTEFKITDAPALKIVEQLVADELDAGLVVQPSYPAMLNVTPLYEEHYVVSFSKGHRFEHVSAVSVNDLEQENYVARLNCELRGRMAEFAKDAKQLKPKVVYKSDQEQWVQSMVASGGGITIHPETLPVVEGILQRPLIDPELKRQVSFVVHKDKADMPVARRLKALLKQQFSA